MEEVMQKVYILVGSPGSGKTWVSNQLKDQYNVVEHDDYKYYKDDTYAKNLISRAIQGSKPVLANTPFGLSALMESLQHHKIEVKPVFIIEHPTVLSRRYQQRENKPIPKGHITRQQTYYDRALELNAFKGTSLEVLNYLKSKV